jgi:hypothetical protein
MILQVYFYDTNTTVCISFVIHVLYIDLDLLSHVDLFWVFIDIENKLPNNHIYFVYKSHLDLDSIVLIHIFICMYTHLYIYFLKDEIDNLDMSCRHQTALFSVPEFTWKQQRGIIKQSKSVWQTLPALGIQHRFYFKVALINAFYGFWKRRIFWIEKRK